MDSAVHDVLFMADHMLIKLGKYLRILGYDAAWDTRVRTHALIARANAEGRFFLTRNAHLADRYIQPDRMLLLHAADPVQQLNAVITALKLDALSGLFSKCVRCNVRLEAVPDKATIRERVHPNVYARQREFFTCPSCHTVFWKGSHVRNTCRKLGLPGGVDRASPGV